MGTELWNEEGIRPQADIPVSVLWPCLSCSLLTSLPDPALENYKLLCLEPSWAGNVNVHSIQALWVFLQNPRASLCGILTF